MDPLFERFQRLVRSYIRFGAPSDEWFEQHKVDNDYQEAWEELNDFLRSGFTGASSSTAGRSTSGRGTSGSTHPLPPEELRKDYVLLGVDFGAGFQEVRTAYRTLMRSHHPDIHAGNKAKQQEATLKSQELNTAYQRIKAWEAAKRGAQPQ